MSGMADTLAANLSKARRFVKSIISHPRPRGDHGNDDLVGLSVVRMKELWALSDSIVPV